MNNNHIAILMATYNGERYLPEQIDSLLAQTYKDWHLYIHDDGSKDNTLALIKDYAQHFPQQISLLDYPPQGGACKNFLSMFERVDADYYMFCDQDDVWLPEKIEMSYQLMREAERSHAPGTPVLVHTDLTVVDENKNVISPSFWRYSRVYPRWFKHYYDYAALNPVTGCTMLFNGKAKETVCRTYDAATMHDSWVTFSVAAANGIIECLDTPTILYRQHRQNTLGAKDASTLKLAYKIGNFFSIVKHKRARFKELHTIRRIPVSEYMAAKKRYKLFLKSQD